MLDRVGIASDHWIPLVTRFGKLFHRIAGAPQSVTRLRHRRRFHTGQAELLASS